LQAIQKSEVAKSAAVCNDHFRIEEFSDIPSRLVSRRQIKSIAVPSCNLNHTST